MIIGQNSLFTQGAFQNKPQKQSAIADMLSDIQIKSPRVDITDFIHNQKVNNLEEITETEQVEETTSTFEIPQITQSNEEKIQSKLEQECKSAIGYASSMDTAIQCLDIAKRYENMASEEGASQETIDYCNAVVNNIKQYVTQMITTGDEIAQRLDTQVQKNYNAIMDLYRSGDTEHELYDQIKDFGIVNSTVEDIVASSGIQNSLQDVGLDNIDYENMSIEEMQELFSNAKEIYLAEAEKLVNTYNSIYTKPEEQISMEQNPPLSLDVLEKELGEGILRMVGLYGEGNIFANSFGEISLENSDAEGISIPKGELNILI